MLRTWTNNQIRKDLSFFDPVFDAIGFDPPADTTDLGTADAIGGVPDTVTLPGTANAEPLADQQQTSAPATDLVQAPVTSEFQATAASSGLQIVDLIPNSDSAESVQNSEPSLAVNPLNPAQMIAGTFSATAMSYFITLNGGATWADYGSLSGDDKSLAWKQDGSAALTATLFPTAGNFGIRTYSGTTTSGSFGSPINTFNPRHDLDQPWIRTGPSNHVYVAYNDLSAAAGKTASVLVSSNGGSTYTAVTLDRVGAGATVGQDAPSIRLAVNGNTAYAAFTRWNSIIDTDSAGEERFTSQVMIVRSDNGGADGFTALGANGNGVQIATPTSWYASTENAPLTLGQERTGGEIAIAVDPNNASHVVVAYGDAPGAMGAAQVKLTVAESTDGGATWKTDYTTPSSVRSALPALAITQNGTIGLLYASYDPVTNRMSQHLLTTSNDFANTTDITLASETNATPVATFDPYVGDFYDMMSVGNTFYGIFSASNADNGSNAQFTNVTFQRDFIGTLGTASFQLTNASGQAVAASIDPFLFTYQAPTSPPMLSNVAANAAWTEESAATTLAPGLSVSDVGTTLMSSATVAITGGTFAGDADVLAATVSGTSITASYNAATETLTLTGTDTLADYQSVLESVVFHAGENPTDYGSNATRTVTWTITDSAGLASTPVTSVISLTNVNDPPTLSNVASSIVAASTATVSLSPSMTVSDPDNLKLTGATVSIIGGTFAGDGDVLAANVSGTGIAASYNSSTETLTLAGSDTLAHYQSVLDSVTWHSTAGDPTNGGANATRTISWVVNDGSASFNLSTAQSETLTLDQPPTLTGLTATASWTEEQAQPTTLSPNVTISDPDGVNTQLSATVSIVGGTFGNDGDVLAADTSGTNISASYNSSSEILTLTGSDSLAHYQQVLDSVTFHAGENPTDFGSNPTRTLVWTVANHLGGESAPATTTVSVTNVNDPPTLSNVATSATLLTGTVSPSLSVSDPDNLNLASATVKITGGSFAGDGDVLAATTAGTGIAASYNSSTQTLTLTGSDTLAHYQTVLDSVTFTAGSNPTNSGSNPTRTISWAINDGTAASTVAVTTITIGSAPRNDFNADAKSDLLLQNAPSVGTPDVRVELLNGTTVGSSATITTPVGWTVQASADFNHDNKADIIVQTADGTPQIWLMNGTSVTSTVTLPNSGTSWHVIATGDFNADGNADIIWQNNDGLPVIWFMNGTSFIGGAVLPNSGPTWHVIGTGDFNADGKSDIIWQNTDGQPFIWEMNGATIIGAGGLPNSGPNWHVIGTGDFNGDGKSDLLWQANDGQPVIWELNGTSIIGAAVLPNSGPTWHAIGTSDFNGDGKSDIIWQNDDGAPFIWEMNGVTMIGAFGLPNPGPTWHIQDDGPIGSDPAGAGAQQPALQLSAPDAANAPMLSAPGGTTASAAGPASSDPGWMHQLHAGTT